MKLIKHLINIMFLWSIPFILLAFFMVLTWFSFSYVAAVTSQLWTVVIFFYCVLTAIIYIVSVGEVDELSIIKTN
jgi:hypothetical protein